MIASSTPIVLTICALVFSFAGVLVAGASFISNRRVQEHGRIEQLEEQVERHQRDIDKLTTELALCTRARQDLEARNFELMSENISYRRRIERKDSGSA